MKATKLTVSAAMALGLGVVLGQGAGCSSSSSPPAAVDAGPEAGPDATAQSCDPLRGVLCPQGQTCCFSGLYGTCEEVGACSTPFQINCTGNASCGGQECCGSIDLPAGFDPQALDAAAFDAAAFDAFDASGFAVSLACAASCGADQFQLCSDTDPCPAGFFCAAGGVGFFATCVPIRDAGGTPDAATDAGTPAGGDGGSEAAAPDAGTEDAGSDAGG